MAEIKIEKKSAPIWPWVLVALAVVALLIYLFSSGDENNERDEMTEVTTSDSSYASSTHEVSENNTAVLAFVSFIRDDPDQMGLDHEFTNEALLRLTNATNAMAEKVGYNAQQDMTQVRTHTQKITSDPFETTHANSIREAAGILAQSLKNIQQKAFSGLASDADGVKSAAAGIKGNVLTLDQKGEIKSFFRKSADLLEKMNSNSPEL